MQQANWGALQKWHAPLVVELQLELESEPVHASFTHTQMKPLTDLKWSLALSLHHSLLLLSLFVELGQ